MLTPRSVLLLVDCFERESNIRKVLRDSCPGCDVYVVRSLTGLLEVFGVGETYLDSLDLAIVSCQVDEANDEILSVLRSKNATAFVPIVMFVGPQLPSSLRESMKTLFLPYSLANVNLRGALQSVLQGLFLPQGATRRS